MGLRSLSETSLIAFIGGVEQAIPYMTGQDGEVGICPQLEDIVGRVRGPGKWRQFLLAGSRTAQEFSSSWLSLKREATDIWAFLSLEPTVTLAQPIETAGGEIGKNTSRKAIMEQREGLRHQLLTKALSTHLDRGQTSHCVPQHI